MTKFDVVEAAKAVRADLRTMAKTDPRLTGVKLRVTTDRFSQGSSLAVRVEGYGGPVFEPRWEEWKTAGGFGGPPCSWQHPDAAELARELYACVERHWDVDGRMHFADVHINGISF